MKKLKFKNLLYSRALYVHFNETETIDLLNTQKISQVDTMLEFWSQSESRLGVNWDWADLYSLGSHHHFEVLDFGACAEYLATE